jgi:IclR family acetate operon transcriptional repressor
VTEAHRPVATVERALAVLQALADAPRDLGNNEIARSVGTNPSTASRLLATLAQDELVRRVPESGRFRLGPRLVELGNAALARVDLRQLARPHLEFLTEATGETATLSIPGEQTTITVDFVQSPSTVRSVAVVGRRSVTHATATGKVFLASTGELPTGPLPSYTRRTITDRRQLAAEVARTAERGWGQAVGEREEDLNAVAAPVIGAHGHLVGVLGLQGPAARFAPRTMRAAAELLVTHAAQLSSISR